MMSALRHPNIVLYLGICPTPPCIVTEYCSRGSLTDVLRSAKIAPNNKASQVTTLNLKVYPPTGSGVII